MVPALLIAAAGPWWDGCVVGCVYALFALGYVLIHETTRVVNFAHGDWAMLGAYVALGLSQHTALRPLPAALASVAVVAVLGGGSARLLVLPFAGRSVLAPLLATLGIGFVLRSAVSITAGTAPRVLDPPLGGHSASSHTADLTVVLAALAATLSLTAFLHATRTGLELRAAADDERTARQLGLRVTRGKVLGWVLGTGLAALAGVLVAPLELLDPQFGSIGLRALGAAALGGFHSLTGAVLGGLCLGLAETAGELWFPGSKPLVSPVLLLLVLLVHPRGLLGVGRSARSAP